MKIKFSPEIIEKAPGLRVVMVNACVVNHPTDETIETLLDNVVSATTQRWSLPMIKERPAIAATRQAYKALGKEPNRYRPAAEALCRRIVRGLGLYRVNALVDIINVLSIETGYSIGGFDADKIDGDTLTLGVGRDGEPYEGIGRGQLNIEHMPVYRDATGGVGTPTSDNERTKISLDTKRLLMIINVYGLEMGLDQTISLAEQLLRDHCGATQIDIKIIDPTEPDKTTI